MELDTDVHHAKPSKFSYSANISHVGAVAAVVKKMAAMSPYLRN